MASVNKRKRLSIGEGGQLGLHQLDQPAGDGAKRPALAGGVAAAAVRPWRGRTVVDGKGA